MGRRRLHMLMAGDVVESAGTRSYLREMIRHFSGIGVEVKCHLFQFRLNDEIPGGENHISDFEEPIHLAPGGRLFRFLPRPAYRFFERLVLWGFMHRALREVSNADALIATGCLGGLHLGAGKLPASSWWLKLGLIEEQTTSGLRFRVRKWVESMHARRFANRIVVSGPMGDFIADEYGPPRAEQFILPCLVDLERFPRLPDREGLRGKLGLQGRFVFTYVGTAAPWQCVREMVTFFSMLHKEMPHAFLWIFTPDIKPFENLLDGLPHDCWRVEFRPHQELASVLPAADVACLLRRRDIVNRVASPLKFAEYLACGLPVMIGPEVGGYSKLVQDKRLGCVIDPDAPASWPQAVDALVDLVGDDQLRQRCRMEAGMLSWQAYTPLLGALFGGRDKVS